MVLSVLRRCHCALAILLMVIALSLGPLTAHSAMAVPLISRALPAADNSQLATTPETLFELNCAGCHVNGGNVIRRGKNLKKRAMERNGYGEVSGIAQIITNGKGIMSAYGDRLSAQEISAIAQYVHDQSESGW